MYKARQKELDQYDLSPRQCAVLFIVQNLGDKATPAEIARWLFREPHSIPELLSRMEKKEGLVRRVKNLDKRRKVKIVLTNKRQQSYSQCVKRNSIREALSCLSGEERQQLWSSLEKIRDKALELITVKKLPFP